MKTPKIWCHHIFYLGPSENAYIRCPNFSGADFLSRIFERASRGDPGAATAAGGGVRRRRIIYGLLKFFDKEKIKTP